MANGIKFNNGANIRKVADKAEALTITPVDGEVIYIYSDDGKDGNWNAVTGAAASAYSTDGGALCGGIIVPTGGDGSAAWIRDASSRTVDGLAEALLLTPQDDQTLNIGGTDGGTFRSVTGAAASTYSSDGGSYCGTVIVPTGGDGSAAWIRDYEGALNVKWFGAVGDGTTDDLISLQQAYDQATSINTAVRFDQGVFRITGPIVMPLAAGLTTYGPGRTKNVTPNSVISSLHLDNAVTDSSCFRFTDATYYSANQTFVDFNFSSEGTGVNQSAVVFEGRSSAWTFTRCTFQTFRGYAIGIKPTAFSYSQNCAIENTSFFDVGGCLGLTEEPATNARYLAITLLKISNVNLDNGLHVNGDVPYIWDFRAIREIQADTFLNEGAGNTAVDSVTVVGTNAVAYFKNVHTEFTTNPPTYQLTCHSDGNDQFYQDTEMLVEIKGYTGEAKIYMGLSTEATVRIKDWFNYFAAQTTDLVVFAGEAGGTVKIEGMRVKTPWALEESYYGRMSLDIASSDNDLKLPFYQSASQLANWNGNDGVLTNCAFGYSYLVEYAPSIATSALEADGNFNVMRYTSVVGNVPEVRVIIDAPASWVGSVVTVKVRYRVSLDAADSAVDFRMVYTNSGANVGQINHNIKNNADYVTATLSLRITAAGAQTIFSRYIGTVPTVAVNLRIAAVEAWLGLPKTSEAMMVDRV